MREDDEAAVVEGDDDEMVGVELDPNDEARVVADDGDKPAVVDGDDRSLSITGENQAPNEPVAQKSVEQPKPEEPPKQQGEEKPKREWNKEKQREDQRKARQERTEMRETIAKLTGELEGMKAILAHLPNVPSAQKEEIKDELDTLLGEIDEKDEFGNETVSAKVMRELVQRVKALQAQNTELVTTAKTLRETEEQRKVRDQQSANAEALARLVDKHPDVRNQLLDMLPELLEHYHYNEDNLPNPDMTEVIVDRGADAIRLKEAYSQKASAQPAPVPPPKKEAVAVPVEKPQPKRSMGLAEKLAQIRKNGYRWQQK